MKNVLVTTDFSPASESAIRFAIHWAEHQELVLTFLNVHHIPRPSNLDDKYFAEYEKTELESARSKLDAFISDMYSENGTALSDFSTLVLPGLDVDVSLLYYLEKNPGFDCICISTRGAGKFKKFLGTNAGNLITKSEIPVLAVPANYKVTDISSVLYATDLVNLERELPKVIDFAKPLKAKIEMLHFSWPNEILFDEKLISESLKNRFGYEFDLHFEKNDAIHSLIQQLNIQISQKTPSMVIMFTNHNRNFFQRLFLSSKSEEFSFVTTVPLLVFNKTTK